MTSILNLQRNYISLFILTLLLIAGLNCILVFYPKAYEILVAEDGFVEYLGFFFLLFSGIIWWKIKNNSEKYKLIYTGIALLFFFGAGEEISWGQRIFGIETPDIIAQINDQKEINFHNINKYYFTHGLELAISVFLILSCVLMAFKKNEVLGVCLPNVTILSIFALSSFYYESFGRGYEFKMNNLHFVVLGMLVYCGIKSENKLIKRISVTSFLFGIGLIFYNLYFDSFFPVHGNGAAEVSETLFSLGVLTFSRYIYLTQITQ